MELEPLVTIIVVPLLDLAARDRTEIGHPPQPPGGNIFEFDLEDGFIEERSLNRRFDHCLHLLNLDHRISKQYLICPDQTIM